MRRDERGLTVAEILVALFVIGVGLVGLLTVVPLATYGVQEGNQLSTATFLADQKLEEIRSAVWGTVPPPVNDNDCLGVGPAVAPTSTTCTRTAPTACVSGATCVTFTDEPAVPGHPSYSRTARITNCALTPCAGITDANLRLVTVSVSYTPLTGAGVATAPKTVKVTLLVAKRT